ncbi:MAG: hypothetical protein AMXMBFR42_02340 [Burkholderiales bacterium]
MGRMATTTLVPPSSRNAPCPCGSARRYKDCHGRAGAPAAMAAPPPGDEIASRLQAALAAQQAGQIGEAIGGYDAVLALRPDLFDAWHMRGVAYFQLQAFDDAERDIRRALALAPGLEAAHGNLALVVQGRRIAEDEAALCREVLPRYAKLVVDPPVAPLDGVGASDRVFVLDAAQDPDVANALARDADARGAACERIVVERGRTIAGDDARLLANCGERDTVVCVGTDRPLGDWTLATRARAVALVVVDNTLSSFIDRLREISGQGRRRVRVAVGAGAGLDPRAIPHVGTAP